MPPKFQIGNSIKILWSHDTEYVIRDVIIGHYSGEYKYFVQKNDRTPPFWVDECNAILSVPKFTGFDNIPDYFERTVKLVDLEKEIKEILAGFDDANQIKSSSEEFDRGYSIAVFSLHRRVEEMLAKFKA